VDSKVCHKLEKGMLLVVWRAVGTMSISVGPKSCRFDVMCGMFWLTLATGVGSSRSGDFVGFVGGWD
jgi:hypothetical protein